MEVDSLGPRTEGEGWRAAPPLKLESKYSHWSLIKHLFMEWLAFLGMLVLPVGTLFKLNYTVLWMHKWLFTIVGQHSHTWTHTLTLCLNPEEPLVCGLGVKTRRVACCDWFPWLRVWGRAGGQIDRVIGWWARGGQRETSHMLCVHWSDLWDKLISLSARCCAANFSGSSVRMDYPSDHRRGSDSLY